MANGATFVVIPAEPSSVPDKELEGLLWNVYVGGGFTDANVAQSALTAAAVRARGELLIARNEQSSQDLLGMVLMVPPTSPARRLAAPNEAEMHLLAVAPEQRGRGIGRALVNAAMQRARERGYERMVLWTQPSMASAHRLYEAAGFERAPAQDFQHGERRFLVMTARLRVT